MSDTRTVDQAAREVLTAAADRLEALLDGIPTGDWRAFPCEPRPSWQIVQFGDTAADTRQVATLRGEYERNPDAEFIAAMSPPVGRTLVALLRRGAWMVRFDPDLAHRLPMDEVLTFARTILGPSDAA